MSMPTLPDQDITREDAINLLLVSIGYEELALAEIMKAEGLKLRAVLSHTSDPYVLKDVNKSIESLLKLVVTKESLLQLKFRDVLELIDMSGLNRKDIHFCNKHKQYYYRKCPGESIKEKYSEWNSGEEEVEEWKTQDSFAFTARSIDEDEHTQTINTSIPKAQNKKMADCKNNSQSFKQCNNPFLVNPSCKCNHHQHKKNKSNKTYYTKSHDTKTSWREDE